MKGMVTVCTNSNIAGGYEIRAANWGIIQQQFAQLPAVVPTCAKVTFGVCYSEAEVYEDQESPLRECGSDW